MLVELAAEMHVTAANQRNDNTRLLLAAPAHDAVLSFESPRSSRLECVSSAVRKYSAGSSRFLAISEKTRAEFFGTLVRSASLWFTWYSPKLSLQEQVQDIFLKKN